MAETRIDQLREIVSQAAAHHAALQQALEALASDLLKELGCEGAPVWAELEADEKDRQVSPFFIMVDGWLRGDLKIAVTPEQIVVAALVMRDAPKQQHEAGQDLERSQTVIINPPDPKHRADALKKLFDRISADLEGQLRRRLAFPAV